MNTRSGQTVAELAASLRRFEAHGGKVPHAPESFGNDRYCAIQDPVGAIPALHEPRSPLA